MIMKDRYQPTHTNSDTESFLDRNGQIYLDNYHIATNIIEERFRPLVTEISNPSDILTIGVGTGDELQALRGIFPSAKILGVDLSLTAIEKAKNKTQKLENPIHFQTADASNLPFENESFDLVIMSALLHEVYSYTVDGNRAWTDAINESSRIIKPDGILLIRDPKAPNGNVDVDIQFKSGLGIDFYNYFREYFRTFEGWNANTKNEIISLQKDRPNLPPMSSSNQICLTQSDAAEILLHFRNFWHAYSSGALSIGDPNWKELQERYLPFGPDNIPMKIDEYVSLIEATANQNLSTSSDKLVNIRKKSSTRPNTDIFLHNHFELYIPQHEDVNSQDLIREMTQTMELSFRKLEI